MSIEIGSKWVKDWEVVYVYAFTSQSDNVNNSRIKWKQLKKL